MTTRCVIGRPDDCSLRATLTLCEALAITVFGVCLVANAVQCALAHQALQIPLLQTTFFQDQDLTP